MKSFAVIAVFGLLAVVIAHPFTEDQLEKAREHVKKCIEQTGADPAVIPKLKAQDYSVQDEKTECLVLCIFREAGFLDENANQIEPVIVEKLSVDKDRKQVQALFDKCKNEGGSSPCNKAFNLYKCYRGAMNFWAFEDVTKIFVFESIDLNKRFLNWNFSISYLREY